MQLPFLKDKINQGGGTALIEKEREADQSSQEKLLEGIGSELMEAISRKDIKALRSALEAICHLIKEQDKD